MSYIAVKWMDCQGPLSFRWGPFEDIEFETKEITTVGFLYKETDDALVIIHNFSSSAYLGYLVIPKSAIIEREYLLPFVKGPAKDINPDELKGKGDA